MVVTTVMFGGVTPPSIGGLLFWADAVAPRAATVRMTRLSKMLFFAMTRAYPHPLCQTNHHHLFPLPFQSTSQPQRDESSRGDAVMLPRHETEY
jgi:hypothetical protein